MIIILFIILLLLGLLMLIFPKFYLEHFNINGITLHNPRYTPVLGVTLAALGIIGTIICIVNLF